MMPLEGVNPVAPVCGNSAIGQTLSKLSHPRCAANAKGMALCCPVSTRHFRLLRFGSFPSEVSTEKYHLCVVSVIVGLSVVLSGCGAAPAPEASAAVEGPEAVVASFYRWCTGYPGNPTDERP